MVAEDDKDETSNSTSDTKVKQCSYSDAVKHDKVYSPPTESLLIGDSLIRKAMDISFVNEVTVCKIGGAKITDIKEKIAQYDKKFKDIFMVVGTNECKNDNFDIDDYSDLISVAQSQIEGGTVFLSSIPPRMDDPEANNTIENINAGLQYTCTELGFTL